MKNKIIFYTLIFFCLASCTKNMDSNGLTEFQQIDSVSNFAVELWKEGNTFKGSFSDDYKTFYFFRKKSSGIEIYIPYTSKFVNGTWTKPVIPGYYNPKYSYTYQLKVPHSKDLYFISNIKTKTDTSQTPNYNFWKTKWNEGKYSEPREFGYENLIYNYNSQPCITKSGTIFFTSDLPDWSQTLSYKMKFENNKYEDPELFEPLNNWRKNPEWSVFEFCVSPNENYIIASIENRTEPNPSVDLYISYKKNVEWSRPVKLKHSINSAETENFPTITNDGKYLIYTKAFSEFKIVPTRLFKP